MYHSQLTGSSRCITVRPTSSADKIRPSYAGYSVDFTGQRILITGSTTGIGRAAAQMFHAAGASVAINGRSAETVAATIEAIGTERLVAAPGDVGSTGGCGAIVEMAAGALGGLDCLVNNAGIGPLARMPDVTDEHWDQVIAVNLRSALFCTKAALPHLRASRGCVIMVSSVAGLLAGPTDSFVYAVSKAGLVGMARTLALELAPDNVRVNCLCPGYIDTPLVQAENQATDGQINLFVSRSTPLGRLGTVRECASSILYLASRDAAYITGTTLVNDGGCLANGSWGVKMQSQPKGL
jgi:NAD(P)-dependent dehydrogenase (short-subunit alcohol dehydrogenase family)